MHEPDYSSTQTHTAAGGIPRTTRAFLPENDTDFDIYFSEAEKIQNKIKNYKPELPDPAVGPGNAAVDSQR
jgi:hypothetical protein